LGTAIAPAIGAIFILSDKVKNTEEIAGLTDTAKESYLAAEASAVQSPFLGITGFIVVLAVVFMFVKLPKLLSSNSSKGGFIEALKHKSLRMGAIGIFVYVGAEVAIGSYLVNYFLDMNMAEAIKNSPTMSSISEFIIGTSLAEVSSLAIVGAFVVFYWSGAMIGRFAGAYLTKVMNPAFVLRIFALLAIVMIFVSMLTQGFVAMWSILAVGLFNSIMFPTIFTLAIEGLDDLKPQASGILCTMIVGGAIIPPLYGFLTDQFGFKLALVLVIVCYSYINTFGKLKANGRI
ncbi:MAG: glucose/galactose MFS transporter, partial [Flavobacteriaceae bacterium]|nr:glucose/galactose MFS transporter [Flavobacteriaceae bacterium]